MPLRIEDIQLAKVYAGLKSDARRSGPRPVDDAPLVDILAAVGDTSSRNSAAVKRRLLAAGSRQELLSIARAGMSKAERNDLCAILDQTRAPLAKRVRNFIEALVDRAELDDGDEPLIIGDQGDGLRGFTTPYASIEARNLSSSVVAGSARTDTFVVADADGDGRFDARMAGLEEGDTVQVRSRDEYDHVSNWVTVRADGLARADRRPAEVAAFRLRVVAKAGGVQITNKQSRRPISEPFATLKITNQRTKKSTTVQLDATGDLAEPISIAGRKGDTFAIAASDGRTNRKFSRLAAVLTAVGPRAKSADAVLPDPGPDKDDILPTGEPKFQKFTMPGKLFRGRAKATDVVQGYIADCYIPAGVAAVAHCRPGLIRKMIRDNEDGTFTVTFKDWDNASGQYANVHVTVDLEMYWDHEKKKVRYGWPGNFFDPDKQANQMILWWPILEKAYASWKGSFHKIGIGGYPSDVMEAITGLRGIYEELEKPDQAWKLIKKSCDDKIPAALATYGEKQEKRYTNTGIHSDHTYTILGTKEKNGQRLVHIRNPWGNSEPKGNGKDDGIFWMTIEEVTKLFQSFSSVQEW